MRMLTDEEIESVFGGDARLTPALPTVTVTGTRFNDTYSFLLAPDSGFTEYTGSGSTSGSGYGVIPMQGVPTPETVKCLVNAAALPGYGWDNAYGLNIVNAYANGEAGPAAERDYLFDNSHPQGAPGYPNFFAAFTYPGSHTDIYANGFLGTQYTGYNSTTGYIVPGDTENVVRPPIPGPFSDREWLVLTTAHETAHQHGVPRDQEELAEGYAVKALQRYRAGNGKSCN